MQNDQKAAGRTRRGALGVLAAAGLAGCSGLTRPTRSEIAAERPVRPTVVIVKNFASGPLEVDVTRASGSTAAGLVGGTSRTVGELEVGHAFANDVTTALVARLRALGLPAEPAGTAPAEGLHPVFVEGQFISVAASKAGESRIVGFRAGYPDVIVDIQVFDRTESGDLLLESVESSVARGTEPVPISMLPSDVLDRADGAGKLSPADAARLRQGAADTADVIMTQLRPIFSDQGWISRAAGAPSGS
jgi:hypothetical protein